MTAITKPKKLTVEQYLSIEQAAEFKSEFFDGEMFAMAGATPEHNVIKENLVGELHAQLKHGPCRSYSSDQRVKITATGLYTYPDLVIVCGAPHFDPADPNTLINPQVVVEVLSPSTAAYDRGTKFRHYQQLESVREIVLISVEEVKIERFVRQADESWLLTTFADRAGLFALTSLAVVIPIVDVYRNVEFPASPPLR